MAKKFTDLSVGSLSDTDIFAIVDTAGEQLNSRKITAQDISSYVYSTDEIASGLNNLKSGLNGTATTDNLLNASALFYVDQTGTGAYRNASYLLDWNNTLNKPVIATDNTQLKNGMSFAGLIENADDTLSLEVRNTVGTTGALVQKVTTDHIQEGSNKYFNDANVVAKINEQFPTLFQSFSDTFDSGNSKDSLQGVNGTWQNATGADAGNQTSREVLINQSGVSANDFAVGQVVRVYGGTTGTPVTMGTAGLTVTANTFNTDGSANNSGNTLNMHYRVAKFDTKTGRIGPRSGVQTQVISLPGGTTSTDFLNAFNSDYYINLALTNLNSTDGVVVYRKVGDTGTSMKLIAVLGPKDLADGNNNWKDYHTFDYVDWSGKSSEDNSYPSSVIHFPAIIAESPDATAGGHNEVLEGWSDLTVESSSPSGLGDGSFIVTFTESATVNHASGILGRACSLAHNDTTTINNSILSKIDPAIGIKSLSLNAKTYNVVTINIPNDFGLTGVTGLTKIRKLPWASYTLPNSDGNPSTQILQSPGITGSTTITLDGIDFDGNAINQFLLADTDGNRFIDFGVQTTDITLNKCKIQNVIGDGVYSSIPLRFKMNLSEISNGGVTDRYDSTPLTIDSGINTVVTGNVIQNFTESIDATVTSEGVIANNVIKNVGAGLNIYGSTFLVTSPNVLMGPANEFLSTPDILNSEFDSINISRASMQAVGTGEPFLSDDFVYQENGVTYDLTQDSIGTNSKVVFRTNLLAVDSDNNFSIYGNEVGPGVKDINNTNMTATTTGGAADADSYLKVNTPYMITHVGNTDWTALGAVINMTGAVFTWNGTTMPSYSASGGRVTANEFPGYENSGHRGPITLTRRTANRQGTGDLVPADGQFGFSIDNANTSGTLQQLINTSGVYSYSTLKNIYTTQLGNSLHPAGTKHYGIAWSANFRTDVKAGDIATAGAWGTAAQLNASGLDNLGLNVYRTSAVDTANANKHYIDYTVEVSNLKYVNIGDQVMVNGKTNLVFPTGYYDATGASATRFNGFVISKTVSGDNHQLIIRYYGGSAPSGQSTGSHVAGAGAGTINIVDDFVMAQGLLK